MERSYLTCNQQRSLAVVWHGQGAVETSWQEQVHRSGGVPVVTFHLFVVILVLSLVGRRTLHELLVTGRKYVPDTTVNVPGASAAKYLLAEEL